MCWTGWRASGPGLGGVATAREDPNGYRGSWTIEVYSLCAY